MSHNNRLLCDDLWHYSWDVCVCTYTSVLQHEWVSLSLSGVIFNLFIHETCDPDDLPPHKEHHGNNSVVKVKSLWTVGLKTSLCIWQLTGRMTSLMANQITPWRLRRETKTLTSEQKVRTTVCVQRYRTLNHVLFFNEQNAVIRRCSTPASMQSVRFYLYNHHNSFLSAANSRRPNRKGLRNDKDKPLPPLLARVGGNIEVSSSALVWDHLVSLFQTTVFHGL